MRHLKPLFDNNKAWAAGRVSQDPGFFQRLCSIQAPKYLWIGCADSRVPANEIVGLDPGELFVHRNVANLVREGDINCLSVLQYAVDVLHVTDVIVCGHYGCGGVQAALGAHVPEPLETWIAPIRETAQAHGEKDWRRLCELNVQAQVEALGRLPLITAAWAAGKTVNLHGWIYDLHDGLLRDLEVRL